MSRDDRLRLAFVGMHPSRSRTLVERWGSSAAVLRAILRGAIRVPDHARRVAGEDAEEHRRVLTAMHVEVLYRGDGCYPAHLAELPDAPDVLFLLGRLPVGPGAAIVGTRRATTYGLRLAGAFGRRLAAAGVPVISGLARGVDGAVHRGTVESGGVGVAVLGSGIGRWYPREHRALGEALVGAGGAVLSEYPPGAPPLGWRFPPRNRIISGLAGLVVVVEARVDGGALITARCALDQGRVVVAVPGDIDRATSEGCNQLIRDGAHPVLGPADLSELAGFVLGALQTGPVVSQKQALPDKGDVDLGALLGPVGRSVDDLAGHFELDPPEILAMVARWEAQGRVRSHGGLITAEPHEG